VRPLTNSGYKFGLAQLAGMAEKAALAITGGTGPVVRGRESLGDDREEFGRGALARTGKITAMFILCKRFRVCMRRIGKENGGAA